MENLDYEEVQQTNPYTYSISGWRDQLLKYKDEEFEYDAIGNPTKYRNKSLEWSYGRLLSKYDNKIQFVYNLNGIRTAKISDFTTRFFLNGNKIIEQVDSKNSIKFYYGAEGLTGFHLTSKDNKNDNIIDSDFFYKKNAQNDIIGIYNSEGKEIAKYYYDAWGNQKIKYLVETDSNTIEYVDIGEDFDYNDISNINRFIAYKNPFRYRSYYWDYETGLYYLNSRYYDPELGRFINSDRLDILWSNFYAIGYKNLYNYCLCNPISYIDSNGFIPVANIINRAKYTLRIKRLINDKFYSKFFGNISISASTTLSDKETGIFYAFSETSVNDIMGSTSVGIGINVYGWLGIELGVSYDYNLYVSVNLTPWIHAGASIGLDGIGLNFGITYENISADIDINIGWGTILLTGLAVAIAPAAAPLVALLGMIFGL